MADQILAEGILEPLADENPHGKGHARKAVFEDDVADLVARIDAAVTTVDGGSNSMVPIAKAAEKAKHPSIDILHLILGGYLQQVTRAEGLGGLAGIRVDSDEVKRTIGQVTIGLSPAEAFQSLQIPVSSGWALVERGALPVITIETPNRRHAVRRFRCDDIERVAEDLTTGARLGGEANVPGPIIERRLRHARIRPIFSRHDVGINLYQTAEAARVMSG